MPQFVLLRHETSRHFERPSHWDLMLEAGDKLRCWALTEALGQTSLQLAEQLADHRLAYLDYEGPVAGDRGHVRRVDRGVCIWITDQEDEMVVLLRGAHFSGRLTICRDSSASQRWRLTFEASE